jgi:protease-4
MNDAPPATSNGNPPVPPVRYAPAALPPCPPKRSAFRRLLSVLGCLVVIGSIFLNVVLLISLVAQSLSLDGLQTRNMDVLEKGDRDQTVIIYRLEGSIHSEATEMFRRFYNEAKDDEKIKAVVLYVDSPGGTVSDSEQIHHMIADLKRRGKTIVASMGGVAASGGYYISAGADEIFAEPSTITGSIGVIAGVLNVEETLDKVGMKVTLLKSDHAKGWKDMLSSVREPEPREKQYVISLLNDMQDQFENVVKDGRGEKLKPREETYTVRVGKGPEAREITRKDLAPFNGKIYLAAAAKEFGLIDEIGFLDDAYNSAAKLAGLSDPHVVVYRPRFDFFEMLAGAKAPAIQIDAESIQNAQTPQFLMLWKPQW